MFNWDEQNFVQLEKSTIHVEDLYKLYTFYEKYRKYAKNHNIHTSDIPNFCMLDLLGWYSNIETAYKKWDISPSDTKDNVCTFINVNSDTSGFLVYYSF